MISDQLPQHPETLNPNTEALPLSAWRSARMQGSGARMKLSARTCQTHAQKVRELSVFNIGA